MILFVHLRLLFLTWYVLFEGWYFMIVICFSITPCAQHRPSTTSCLIHVCFCVDVLRGNSAYAVGKVPLPFGSMESLPKQIFLFQLTGDPCPKGLEPNLKRADYKPAQTTKDYFSVHLALELPKSWHKASLRLPVISLKKARQGFRPSVLCSGNPCLQHLFWHCISYTKGIVWIISCLTN